MATSSAALFWWRVVGLGAVLGYAHGASAYVRARDEQTGQPLRLRVVRGPRLYLHSSWAAGALGQVEDPAVAERATRLALQILKRLPDGISDAEVIGALAREMATADPTLMEHVIIHYLTHHAHGPGPSTTDS